MTLGGLGIKGDFTFLSTGVPSTVVGQILTAVDTTGKLKWTDPAVVVAKNILLCSGSWSCANAVGMPREISASYPSAQNVFNASASRAGATAACVAKGYDYIGYLYQSQSTGSCGRLFGVTWWTGSGWTWANVRGCSSSEVFITAIYCKDKSVTLPPNSQS